MRRSLQLFSKKLANKNLSEEDKLSVASQTFFSRSLIDGSIKSGTVRVVARRDGYSFIKERE